MKPTRKAPSWRQRFKQFSAPSWRVASKRNPTAFKIQIPGWGWLKPLRPFLPIIVAAVFLLIIGSVLYLRFWILEEQPQNSEVPLPNCSIYPARKKLAEGEQYGYLIFVDDRRIERVLIVHLGNNVDQRSYARIVPLPVQFWLPIIDSTRFKQVTISNLLAAGEVDQPDNPLCFVLKNISYQVGAPVDFVIVEKKQGGRYVTEAALLQNRSPVGTLDTFWELLHWNSVSANITNIELVNLKKQLWLSQDQRKEYEFPSNAYQEVISSNAEKLKVIDFSKFTEAYPEALASEAIGSEQALVEIYNGTEGKGLASIYSRFLKTVGVDIIRLGNVTPGEYPVDLDIYITNEKQYPITLATISKVFSDRPIRYFYQQRPTNVVTTGDIIIVIRKE